jgi:hypothetical protein
MSERRHPTEREKPVTIGRGRSGVELVQAIRDGDLTVPEALLRELEAELTIEQRARRHALAASRLLERVEAAEQDDGRDPAVRRLNRDLSFRVELAAAHAATSAALSAIAAKPVALSATLESTEDER